MPNPKTKRSAAFLAVMELPDAVEEGSEPSFVIPCFSSSFAAQPMIKIMTVVVAPGQTPGELLAALTGEKKHNLVSRPAISLEH